MSRLAVVEALRAAQRLCQVALPRFNWSASALDAEAIQLLNEVPAQINAALKVTEPHPIKWAGIVALINEYAMHVTDAASHQSASRADLSQTAALKTLDKLRLVYAELGLLQCDCQTTTHPNGSRLTVCGSEQMRRAVEQRHAFLDEIRGGL